MKKQIMAVRTAVITGAGAAVMNLLHSQENRFSYRQGRRWYD